MRRCRRPTTRWAGTEPRPRKDISMTTRGSSGSAVSRRHLLRASVAGAALLPLGDFPRGGGALPLSGGTSGVVAARPRTASPATSHTWLLSSADELRPTAPAAPTAEELAE